MIEGVVVTKKNDGWQLSRLLRGAREETAAARRREA